MRLIAWNANFNNRRRTLEQTAALLAPLHADIHVLSEVPPPNESNPLNAKWMGDKAPGLAVFARDGLTLDAHPANDGAPTLMGGFSVGGELNFSLLAVWPVQRKDAPTYHEILMTGLDRFSELLKCDNAIMAGDFNSNTRVSFQERTHPKFVAAAEAFGLASAYHLQTGELHGQETVATYRHGLSDDKLFHIDYCFVSRQLASSANLSVLRSAYWTQLSDHYPVVIDVPDAVLRGSL